LVKELSCEKCGKTWRVQVPVELKARVQSCQACGKFKFHLEPANPKYSSLKGMR